MIRELRTLLAVAREGTFARAGAKVGLTQAAVSAQMRRLEEGLGFALFEKHGRAAQLTARGTQVLAQAQELLALYEQLGSAGTAEAGVTRIQLGAIASIQRTLLPDALARFHREHPNAHTRIVPGVSIDLVNRVDAGELDLAVVIRPPFGLHSDLHWSTLVREPFRLLVPRTTPGADWAELLATQPFVRYERTSFGGRQVERFLRERQLRPHEVCEADELEAIVRLVADGVGVALMPEPVMHGAWPRRVRALDLGEQTFHRDLGLVFRTHPAPAGALASLIACIDAQAAAAQRGRK
ncbi:LysR family transcriptional regulator [Verticiella sediminum]|uniref:LysR family transcriptional regulator n=1 Tax=Verticiella sediminum TaxID=1247510 RepID=A0A556ACD1_9BURK|nr:LysR substrate-binding domain-containing protein [Verticiella sediminum]TSH90545.1 LysR family transcriptional regulator [Verticiella sediminum]